MSSLFNTFTNMPVPSIFLNREYIIEITLTKEDLPYYIHNQASVPGWSVMTLQDIYPDPMKMYEYRFLELFGFAIKKGNSYFIHESADKRLYNAETGLFSQPKQYLQDFETFLEETILGAYLALNMYSLHMFPNSIALQHLDMDIKDMRLLLSDHNVEK